MNEIPCDTAAATTTDISHDQTTATASVAPGHLQAIARLHGLHTTPLATARILELQANAGTALLTYAFAYPLARIVSIATGTTQVDDSEPAAGRSDLDNLQRRAGVLSEITADLGEFDYILCSGPFEQVSPDAQQRFLSICAQNLAPHGVACIRHSASQHTTMHVHPALADHRLEYLAYAPSGAEPPPPCSDSANTGLLSLDSTGNDAAQRSGTPIKITLIHRVSPLHRPSTKLNTNALTDMHFGMWVSPIAQSVDAPSAHERYRTSTGKLLISNGAVTTHVIETLRHVWPASVRFSQLIARIRKYMPRRRGDALTTAVKKSLVYLMESGALKYHLEPPGYVELSRSANKPRLLPAAVRALAATGDNVPFVAVPNLWHEEAVLPHDPVIQTIVPHLDGTTTIPKLRGVVRQALGDGDLAMPAGYPSTGRCNLNGQALQLLLPALQTLRQRGLLL